MLAILSSELWLLFCNCIANLTEFGYRSNAIRERVNKIIWETTDIEKKSL